MITLAFLVAVLAGIALNFLERGWNGENFHEVTENLRSSDP